MKPLLDDPAAEWDKPAVTQVSRGTPTATGEPTGKNPWFMGYSVRDERYRYTEWDGGKKGTQLYDYETDPGELKNLADDPAARRHGEADSRRCYRRSSTSRDDADDAVAKLAGHRLADRATA